MSDLLPVVALLALFLGPVAGFWWLYRVYLHRRARKTGVPAAVTGETAEPAGGQRVSFPIGVPFVVYPLLLWGIVEGSAHWWGWIFQVVYIGLLALFSREALSRAEYQKAHAKDPSLSRMTWVINWLLFFVVLPAVVWAVTMVLLLGELPSRSP